MESKGSAVGRDRGGGGGGRVEVTGVALGGRGEQVLAGVTAEVVPVVVGAGAGRNL